MEASKTFTVEEVAKHNKANDCWIIVYGKVFDVTKFLDEHPGGKNVIVKKAGQDASAEFKMFHNADVLRKFESKLCIGTIGTAKAPTKTPPTAAPPRTEAKRPNPNASSLLSLISSAPYGDLIPYGDPSWYQAWNSPYYSESHRKYRDVVRKFVENEVIPFVDDWDEAKAVPSTFFKKTYECGLLPGVVAPPWPVEYVGTSICGGIIKPEEYDSFHDLILNDELARCASGGVVWCVAGLSIGLPPVMMFGSKYLKDKVCRPCLTGEKTICLCITEPYAGSDVANLRTTATKTPDGKFFIVNGEKKWITNGVFADFFTVAVRTGGEGMGGISLLLIERTEGVTTRQMKCTGVWPSGTTFITFDNVRVPVENLIGRENEGFKYVMYNFNHERWSSAVHATRFARVCLEESIKYAMKRETFGKKLIEHPVIRFKLAQMARLVESTTSWIETITFQVKTQSKKLQNETLGGPIALLKAHASQVFEYCAREAAQIFGGLAYTRGGQGGKVERLYREVRAYSIPAGSEEIMLDLAIRQAMKQLGKSKL